MAAAESCQPQQAFSAHLGMAFHFVSEELHAMLLALQHVRPSFGQNSLIIFNHYLPLKLLFPLKFHSQALHVALLCHHKDIVFLCSPGISGNIHANQAAKAAC